MFRPSVTTLGLRPLLQCARLLHLAPKVSGLTTQSANTATRNHCRKLSLSSHDPRWASSQESREEADDQSESLAVKQHLSKLSTEEQNEYAEAELQKLSAQDEKRLRVLEMEYDVWMSTGVRVPEEVSQSMWLQLMHTPSRNGRMRLYSFWFKRECTIRGAERKKMERRELHLKKQAEKKLMLEEQAKELGLPEDQLPSKNTIHMFVRSQTMLKHQYNNLIWAIQFSQTLVMDLSLESHMKDRERTSVIKQLLEAYGVNKRQHEPFNLIMTGLTEDGLIDRKLRNHLNPAVLPLTMTSESYLDLYPRDRLVYMTPDSPNELLTWSPHDIYIIGALVDLGNSKPVTLAKAKSENLRTVRLPLDRFMLWKQGGKALTLDLFMKICCEMKDNGDWIKAFEPIPKRKAELRPQARKSYMKRNSLKSGY